MKLAALFTGGKDSTYTIHLARKAGHEVSCLITIKSENEDSYMFHTPAIELTELQSEAMEIPILIKETKGEKETELKDLKQAIKEAKALYNFEGVVTGAVASVYQATRVQKICSELGLWCFNPVWLRNQSKYVKELIDEKFEIIFTGIAADGLNKDWLNKVIVDEDLQKLNQLNDKIGLSPSGEGGEFESLVINCPLFKHKIELTKFEKRMENEYTGRLIIEEAELK